MEAALKPLMRLQATHQAFAVAERELVASLGVPICIAGCGKCCEITTPMSWAIEAEFAVSWLLGQGTQISSALSICEGWLLDHDPRLATYGMYGNLSPDQWGRLRGEVDALLGEMPCPLLAEDKTCLIHGARPLACRAYGVTHLPARWCPRPLSRYETDEARAHIGEQSPVGQKIRQMVEMTAGASSGFLISPGGVRFLPTALFAMLRPDRLNALVADGLIASAKLVSLQQNPAILFQSQLDEVWRKLGVGRSTPTISGGENHVG